jgi:hypothetical protein
MLARVDGKSPVEYLNATAQTRVREFARRAIANGFCNVEALVEAWTLEAANEDHD